MSNDNQGHTFWEWLDLGNTVGTCFIVILLFLIYVAGSAVAIEKGLEIDRLSDQLDNGQRQYVYATPTPDTFAVDKPKSRGQQMRETAKRNREEANRKFWAGR